MGAEISSDLPTGISMSDVTEENFPDPHFRNWLKSLDKDIEATAEVLDYYELGYIGSSSLDENYDVPTTDEENSKINTQFRIQWSGGLYRKWRHNRGRSDREHRGGGSRCCWAENL